MIEKEYRDELDILLYNYFENKIDKKLFMDFIKKHDLNYDFLKERYIWLKEFGLDPNVIHLNSNHKQIYEIFDNINKMFNEQEIEYYYTSGILSYLLVDKELERYHHDLDIFVNMEDMEKLENVCGDYDFDFKRVLGDRPDGTKRVMLKMYYKNIIDIPITIFMYVRKNDKSIEQNDYFIDDNKFFVEKIYNSPEIVDLSFSDEPKYHNNIEYYAITLEALYISKEGNRPKDKYDCLKFKDNVDFNKLDKLRKAFESNKKNEVFAAEEDDYYDFIFGEMKSKSMVLSK